MKEAKSLPKSLVIVQLLETTYSRISTTWAGVVAQAIA
jgi:hypothetical protein